MARGTRRKLKKIYDLVCDNSNPAGVLAIHHLAKCNEEMRQARQFAREACIPESEWAEMCAAMPWHPFRELLGTLH
jgi:hypothetical protein